MGYLLPNRVLQGPGKNWSLLTDKIHHHQNAGSFTEDPEHIMSLPIS
jgi:hypothetical protein